MVVTAPALGARSLSALHRLAARGANITALFVDLDRHKVLGRIKPNNRLTPASVTKLFTTAAALEKWGPDHRFVTTLRSDGAIKGHTLKGDLMLLGAGDPTLDYAQLWRLTQRLRQRGIHRIAGDLIINDSLFGDVPCLTMDRCRARSDSAHSYDAPLSAAGADFSTVQVTALPAAKPGKPATLALMPPNLVGYRIEGHIKTLTAHTRRSVFAWRDTGDGQSTVHVAGHVPVGGGQYDLTRSVASGSRFAGRLLAAVIAGSGIRVKGKVRVDSDPPGPGWHELARTLSPPLANQLRLMLTYSNNYMADTLTLDLLAYADDDQEDAAETGDAGAAHPALTLPAAGAHLKELAQRANQEASTWLAQPPHPDRGLELDSGSGLTVSNNVSARDIVSLLAYMHVQDALFPAFLGDLPVPQSTPSHRVKHGNIDFATKVAAKTGTLSQPVSVFGYAGYMRLAHGHWGAFAVLVNGRENHSPIPAGHAMAAIRRDIEALLARKH